MDEVCEYRRLLRALGLDWCEPPTPKAEVMRIATDMIDEQRDRLLEHRRWQNMLWTFSTSIFWIGMMAGVVAALLLATWKR